MNLPPHPLSGHHRHGLDNINEGLADTLDSLTKGLADYLNRLTGDKTKEPTQAEKLEAYAMLMAWHELETEDEKRRVLCEAADYCKGQFGPAEPGAGISGDQQPETHAQQVQERVIPVPEYIRKLPDYETILARQRELAAQELARYQGIANQARIEAADAREEQREQRERYEARQDPATPGIERGDPDPYAQAAQELDATPLQEGQEAEGEVIDVAQVDGQNYYVIEQEGERVAVPAGEKPEYRRGDDITASRSPEGIEVAEAYGYGR